MKKIRVVGRVDVTVSTVIEVGKQQNPSQKEIFETATAQFAGVLQFIGNGGYGEKLIGVDGEYDTIMPDSCVKFHDYWEEKQCETH